MLAYYEYGLGLIPDGKEKSIDLTFGSLVHDAVDIFHKTGDIKDAILLIESSDFASTHKRKNKAVAKALLQQYAKKCPNLRLIESETTKLCNQDLAFNVGRHLWRLRIDSIIVHENRKWVGENKTTKRDYLLIRPNDQFISYYIAAKRIDPEISGVMIQSFDPELVSVEPIFFSPTAQECEHWLKEMEFTIDHLERCALENIFPSNPSACLQFGASRACYCLPLCQAQFKEDKERLIAKFYKINEEAVALSW